MTTTTPAAALVIIRGLPAAGKTTFVRKRMAEMANPGEAARISRVDLRIMLFGRNSGLSREQEAVITRMARYSARGLLQQGISVYIDDMNLNPSYQRDWEDMARRCGVPSFVSDITTPLDECIKRDRKRKGQLDHVGETALRAIAEHWAGWQNR